MNQSLLLRYNEVGLKGKNRSHFEERLALNVRKLVERKYRRQQNRFLVEGLQLLSLAVEMMGTPQGRARVKPLELFYSEELFTGDTAFLREYYPVMKGAAEFFLDFLVVARTASSASKICCLCVLTGGASPAPRGRRRRRGPLVRAP